MGENNAQARLIQAIEYLRNNGKARRQEDIASAMGVPRPHVSTAMKGDVRRLNDSFLHRFAKAYSDYINEDWLLTGEGRMEKPDRHNTRPHIPMSVAAGPTGIAISTISEAETEHRPVIADLPSYDFTIGVMGDSMYPVLTNGDTVACRRLESSGEIKANTIYVIETTEGAVVKQIAHIADNGITLHSLNPRFSDYIISPSSVISISQIVGLVRPFSI